MVNPMVKGGRTVAGLWWITEEKPRSVAGSKGITGFTVSTLSRGSDLINVEGRGFHCHYHQFTFQGDFDGLLTQEINTVLGAQARFGHRDLNRRSVDHVLAIQEELGIDSRSEVPLNPGAGDSVIGSGDGYRAAFLYRSASSSPDQAQRIVDLIIRGGQRSRPFFYYQADLRNVALANGHALGRGRQHDNN